MQRGTCNFMQNRKCYLKAEPRALKLQSTLLFALCIPSLPLALSVSLSFCLSLSHKNTRLFHTCAHVRAHTHTPSYLIPSSYKNQESSYRFLCKDTILPPPASLPPPPHPLPFPNGSNLQGILASPRLSCSILIKCFKCSLSMVK